MSNDKYSIKWNDYKNAVSSSFDTLRQEEQLFDVTLVTDDDTFVPAHKFVLSATSSFFKSLFTKINQREPVIYLGSVSGKNLNYILDYIYSGETKMVEEDLDAFLKVSKCLKVKGLSKLQRQETNEKMSNGSGVKDIDSKYQITYKEDLLSIKQQGQAPSPKQMNNSALIELASPKIPDIHIDDNTSLAVEEIIEVAENATISSNEQVQDREGNGECSPAKKRKRKNKDSDMLKKVMVTSEDEADRVINENIGKKDGILYCKLCFFTSKQKGNAKYHVEKKHIKGIVYTCSVCDKQYDTRISIYNHQKIHMTDED